MNTVRAVRPWSIAVVGLGPVGSHHAERLALRRGVASVIGCDTNRKSRERAPSVLADVVSEADRVFDDERIELVVIATPPSTRAELALRSLRAGKHVIVASPSALTHDDCEQLAAEAQRHGKSLRLARNEHSDADFEAVSKMIADGRLGRCLSARRRLWTWTAERNRDASAECGPKSDVAEAGDALLEFGVPLLDQLLRIIDDSPSAVVASARGDIDPGRELPGFFAEIRFDGGATGQIDVDTHSVVTDDAGWRLLGTAGGYAGGRLFQRADDGEIFDQPFGAQPGAHPLDRFYDAVLASIESGEVDRAALARAAAVMRIAEAIRASLASGQVVGLA